MKICKVFDREDIEKAVWIYDFLEEIGRDFCNDVAIPWWIEEYEDDTDFRKAVNNYLISQGCTYGEKVYIDITW